ncbi:MAG: hypothetical protein AB7Q42_21905, partial [Acidimicrobiia bacterium]
MSRRIEIELTSARPDGTWTWRAAGAREPKGVVEATVLPDSPKVGDVLKVEAEFELEGISILSVVSGGRTRKEPALIELLPADRPFEPVMQTLAKRERGDRGDRGDRPRRDRPDRPRRDDDRRGPRSDSDRRGPRPDGAPSGADRPRRDRPDRPQRPRFEAPPELPQRPRPKRLKPGKAHRSAVLTELPEAQRAIAEKALQGGLPAVRQAVNEQNATLRAEGKEEVPAAGLLKMAEELLPRLRVAEWLDRADAAKADLDELDLRDLRSVVAAADDPMVTRDEAARELANELKAALVTKQEKASQEWLEDIGLALGVGRVIRALKLSSEPPKAGMRFPADLAQQLADAATASLTTDATADRWSAVLEAVAFSPVRTHVTPAAPPTTSSDELTVTVTRLAPLVPQIAAVFGITPAPGAPMPKPQRAPRKPERKPGSGAGAGGGAAGAGGGGQRPPRPAGSPSGRPPKQAAQQPKEAAAETTAAPAADEATIAAEPTTTEPTTTETAVTEPAAAEPTATESVATEPTATEPAATEPVAAEPT